MDSEAVAVPPAAAQPFGKPLKPIAFVPLPEKSDQPESDFNAVAEPPKYPLLFKQSSNAIKSCWEGMCHNNRKADQSQQYCLNRQYLPTDISLADQVNFPIHAKNPFCNRYIVVVSDRL